MQPKVLQKLLGHASIKTTMDRYVHVTTDSLDQAVKQFQLNGVFDENQCNFMRGWCKNGVTAETPNRKNPCKSKKKQRRMKIYEIRYREACPTWEKAPFSTPSPTPAPSRPTILSAPLNPMWGLWQCRMSGWTCWPKCTIRTNTPLPSSRFVDIAGLVKGASKARARQQVSVPHPGSGRYHSCGRCFESTEIIHVDGEIGPAQDIETINLELIFSDLDVLDRRIDKAQKAAKADKKYLEEVELLQRLKAHLEQGKSARSFQTASDEEEQILSSISLLSSKPVIYAANLSEDDFLGSLEENPFYRQVCEIAAAEGSLVLPICAKIEEDIADMSKEDKQLFLDELGLESSGLDRLIQKGYELLGLISYLTAGKQEVRAWTIKKGTKAPQAAGKIHSDFEKALSGRRL